MSYGPAAKSSWLTCGLWSKDTAGKMEDQAGENQGRIKRKRDIAGEEFGMMGKLHVDLLNQERYLLNKVNMKVRLVRSSNDFVLMADTENQYKVIVKNIILFVRKVKLNASLMEAHIKALEKSTAKYPLRRITTKVYSVPRGNLTGNEDNLFSGQLPQRVIIGCVDNDAYNGSIYKNPYNFKHYDINFVALYVAGQQIPTKPLQPNFERGQFVRSYQTLFSALKKLGQDEGSEITRTDYPAGYTLFAFDLTPGLDEQGHFNRHQSGPMRLALRFAKPLPNTINVIVLAEFENTLEIDRDRNILFDYTN